ncbi:hypothetical protein [Streptomyces violascens]|uniref:hypothetical protein n=1 Tax=Streptomyces violascens TaxID=67381 RepID=UPI001677FBBC|nr:hypothetical protein [Streptomyces violascens]GGU40973.1 hypothetical protein GCM10010289_72330 [Streptomyces violascens]
MITIEFTPDDRGDILNETARKSLHEGLFTLESLTPTDFRYSYFVYPTLLNIGGMQFLPNAPVPIMDLMYCLGYSLRDLPRDGKSEISFTENSEIIHLVLSGDTVKADSSANPDRHGECPASEYYHAVRTFIASGMRHILGKYPQLDGHQAFSELAELAVA